MSKLSLKKFLQKRPTQEEAHLFTEITDISTLFRVASDEAIDASRSNASIKS